MMWPYVLAFVLGMGVGMVLMGQMAGAWARRHGAAYVIKHLEIEKP